MRGNIQRRYTMERLHIYADDKVPEEIKQNITSAIPRLREVPVRLDSHSEEYVKKFPKIWDYPSDYIVR